MNENPGGTPNPLNPTPLDANPSEPIGETPVQETPVQAEPVQEPVQAEPVQEPVQEPASQPLTEELVEESTHVSSLDPEGRPMEKASETPIATATPKKKKTGLIVGLVICLFIAVGCGVAAILMMMNSSKDPVSTAVEKLLNGEVQANVGVNGSIEVLFNDSSSQVSKADIALNSQLKTGSMINSTTADVTLTMSDASESAFRLSEVYADSQDLYLKVEKKEMTILDETEKLLDETNCIGDETGETNCLTETETTTTTTTTTTTEEESSLVVSDTASMVDSIIGMIDGQWIKLSLASTGEMTGNVTLDSDVTCMVNAVKNMNTNSNSLAEYYKNNPFISSTTENIPVSSKLNQLRQIMIDTEKFTNFANAVQNTSMATAISECLESDDTTQITTSDVVNNLSKMPAIYVEVNPDNTFSRLYTKISSDDGMYTITVDLSFTYPTSIDVSEPVEYTDFEQLMQGMMGGFDDIIIEDDTEEEVEEEEDAEEEESDSETE
ncbi:hypothetical protein IJH15_01840 [Candidatus Saccharibacteria bacterium]|nr:hypothetical protein [Candidatus Saccharibacteria bacterium]